MALIEPNDLRGDAVGAGFTGALAAIVVFYFMLPFAAQPLLAGRMSDIAGILLVVLPQVLALFTALRLRRKFAGKNVPEYDVAPLPAKNMLHLFWALPLLLAAVGAFGSGWKVLLDTLGIHYGEPPTEALIRAATPPLLLSFFAAAVFIAPVVEEVLFRDLLYQGLKRYSGMVTAAAGGALIFAALHNTLLQFAPLFLLGLAFQLARAKFGLLFAITLHMANNLIAFAFAMWFFRYV